MPRPLVFGNGSLLINLDAQGNIRDLFWPYVGMPNHLQGYKIRMGIWVDGAFSWLDADGWHRSQSYHVDGLVGESVFFNESLGIRLHVHEGLHPRIPVFVREIQIECLGTSRKEVRIFLNNDFRIAETDIGDTAFYHPESDSLIHYKGKYAFLLGGATAEGGIYESTTGIKAFNGTPGTWVDAEDGHLHFNAISQGSVDSTFSVRTLVEPSAPSHATFWIACGDGIEAAVETFESTGGAKAVGSILDLSSHWWRTWSMCDPTDTQDLPEAVERLYARSIQIIRTQCDNRGAILAANDSDIMETNRATYSFLWPRDGALVSLVTDAAGQPEIARGFFEFCLQLITKDSPILLHKYAPDGTLGASWHPWMVGGTAEVPFQQDETALTIMAMGRHLKRYPDACRLLRWFEDFVSPASDYLDLYRDSRGLPMPSYDLWEERRGVHAFTVATTIAAFDEAAWMAALLGDPREVEYRRVADDMRHAAMAHLWDDERGVFFRRLDDHGEPDRTLDSAVLSFGLYGAFDPQSDTMRRCTDTIESALRIKNGIDGVARYEHDYYFRRVEEQPGNPWVICTMWLAQMRMLQAQSLEELRATEDFLIWTTHRAASTGVLSEQYHPYTGEVLSVSPLTWSHAEFGAAVQLYQKRYAEFGALAP